MKSQINLLHDEFVPKFEWVCANHFLGLIVAVILLCSGMYGVAGQMYQSKQNQVAALQSQIDEQQNTINTLTQTLTQKATDPLLQSELTSLTEQSRTRGSLLNHIRNLSALKQRSFSVMFDSLAQSSSSDLWLTNFLVTPEELKIEGGISQPRALPAWISQLSKTDFFQGQEFSLASVDRGESGLTFKLKSVSKEEALLVAQAGGE